MRKLLILCFLCFTWIARGQDEYRWHYWFDANHDAVVSGTTQSRFFTIDADASNLDFGAHTFNIQVEGKDGKSSSPISKYFYYSNSKLDKLTYWFDNDTQSMKEESGKDGHFILDVSSIDPGIHFINLMLKDASGKISEIKQQCFYRVINKTATKLTYWFDDDESTKETIPFHDGTSMFDVSKLEEGFHTISIVTHDYTSSAIATRMFIKVPQTQGGDFDMVCLCSVDGKLVAQDRLPSTGGILNFNLDVNSIGPGLHKALFQTITPTGAASNTVERYFIRTTTDNEIATMKCLYSIDDAKTFTQAGNFANGLFHFDLDVASLEDGLHRLAYMLIADNGVSTPMQSAFFWKTPVGGNAIIQYDYWLNENEDNTKKVTLAERNNPFSLITLLPIESCPIRSSCFHFEVKDGKPMMYARNDIHFRFFDVAARLAEATNQFVDYSISQEVTDIDEIQSTQTFARPAENAVKWFKVDVEEGDTVAFKSSQATSIQVFSPNGKEVYSASGDKSVKFDGCHTWEDGTYYVAVHDVTGTKQNVTLDYMHMDKYDVVDQDVRVVGNGGCSTITFQGNGFKDLYAVDLKDSKGNIIESIDVGHESDATTTVTFDFTDTKLGKYNAVFHFTEEDKTFTNCITVEEAKDIELATTVSYPSAFLRGTSVTYTVEITNKGNMTAYSVPVYTYIESQTEQGVSYIKYLGMDFPNVFSEVDSSLLSKTQMDELLRYGETLGDEAYFLKGFVTTDNQADSVFVRTNYALVSIPPNATRTYQLQVMSSETLTVWISVPNDWITYQTDHPLNALARRTNMASLSSSHSDWADKYCCYKDQLECYVQEIATGLDVVSLTLSLSALASIGLAETGLPEALETGALMAGVASCKASINNDKFKVFNSTFCNSDGNNLPLDLLKSLLKAKYSVASPQTVIGCIGSLLSSLGIGGETAKAVITVISNHITTFNIIGGISTQLDCKKRSLAKSPGCPPDPDGGGGSSSPVNSLDPNDIFGYIAPSGSMHIGEDVVNVSYRIEFENDTTFASSAAHKVVIKDTLNAKAFDLSSYQPTSIKIGEKSVQLKGDKTFVTTVDMRPEINAIAQVEGLYDEKKGIATWRFTSLDPMTMEPTDDIMQGFLPVNYDGSGIGEVAYNINRKSELSDGTAISNKASIVFDSNDAIETPTWTNIIDAVPPVSHLSEVEQVNDTIVRVHFNGEDNSSGVWKYALYVQHGEVASWLQVAETDTTCFDFRIYEDVDYGFCVVATDSAGNVEKKIIQREYKFLNGKGELIDGISSPRENQVATNRAYDLSGRLIQEEGYRGIIIKNRKKSFKR